jgi:hypothetical protein
MEKSKNAPSVGTDMNGIVRRSDMKGSVVRKAGPLPAAEPMAGPVSEYKLTPEQKDAYGPIKTRTCKCCKKELPILQFRPPTSKRTFSGLSGLCDTCRGCMEARRKSR